jgi:hypothetical protein
MVEATAGFRLDPTSILDVYKVFWHLDMLRMGIWDRPYTYTVRTVQEVWGGFWGFEVGLSQSDVVMSWLMVEATTAGFRLDLTSILDVYKVLEA